MPLREESDRDIGPLRPQPLGQYIGSAAISAVRSRRLKDIGKIYWINRYWPGDARSPARGGRSMTEKSAREQDADTLSSDAPRPMGRRDFFRGVTGVTLGSLGSAALLTQLQPTRAFAADSESPL